MEALPMMRFRMFLPLVFAGVLSTACGSGQGGEGGELVYRHHFSGLRAVASHGELPRLQAVLALRESQEVLQEVSRKLAAALPTWFGGPALGTNDALVYQPLLRSLMDTETVLEVRERNGQVTTWALAARVDAGSAALVTAGESLRRLAGTLGETSEVAGGGFRLALPGGKGGLELLLTQGWLGLGRGTLDLAKFVEAASGKPSGTAAGSTNGVLEVEADLGRLAPLLGLRERPPGPVDQWPMVRAHWVPRNGGLRTTAEFRFPGPLGLTSESWQMPTNVLRDPLVGFTAARGAGTWLSRLGLFKDLGVTEWPEQLFLWSLAGDPWLQYFSAPIVAPTNLMAQVALTLPVRAVTNMLWSDSMFALRVTNQARRVELRGLPYFAPFMEAQRTAAGEQLFGGLFPNTPGPRPAPAGLLQQVEGRTNLVLYDWETTGRRFVMTNPPGAPGPRVLTNDMGRLVQFRHLAQFARLMLARDPLRLPSGKGGELLIPGSRWIDAAIPLLGDSVTEVRRTGERELAGTRQSVTGFNSMELLYLLRWIENPGFPGWQEPPAPTLRTRPPSPASPPGPGAPASLPPPTKAAGNP